MGRTLQLLDHIWTFAVLFVSSGQSEKLFRKPGLVPLSPKKRMFWSSNFFNTDWSRTEDMAWFVCFAKVYVLFLVRFVCFNKSKVSKHMFESSLDCCWQTQLSSGSPRNPRTWAFFPRIVIRQLFAYLHPPAIVEQRFGSFFPFETAFCSQRLPPMLRSLDRTHCNWTAFMRKCLVRSRLCSGPFEAVFVVLTP